MGSVSLDELNADLASREVEWHFDVRWVHFEAGQLNIHLQPFLQDENVNRYDTYVLSCNNCTWLLLDDPSLTMCTKVVCTPNETGSHVKLVFENYVGGAPGFLGIELKCESISFARQAQGKILPPDVQPIEDADEVGCCLWPFPWPFNTSSQSQEQDKGKVPAEWTSDLKDTIFELPSVRWFVMDGDLAEFVLTYWNRQYGAKIELKSCHSFDFYPHTATEGGVDTYCTKVEDVGGGNSQLSIRGVYGSPGCPPGNDDSDSEYLCHEPTYYDAVFCSIRYVGSEITALNKAALRRLRRELEERH